MIVVDSNVFAKLFIDEADSQQAKDFFRYCVSQEVPLLAPSLFTYEILQIATYYRYSIQDALAMVEDYKAFNLTLVELKSEEWELVENMVQTGHQNSGYPSLYDSCYHALAINNDCMFLTADRRHAVKAESFGHLQLLNDWQTPEL